MSEYEDHDERTPEQREIDKYKGLIILLVLVLGVAIGSLLR